MRDYTRSVDATIDCTSIQATPRTVVPQPLTQAKELPPGSERVSRRHRIMIAASVVWLPLHLVLLIIFSLNPSLPDWVGLLLAIGGLAWTASAYIIYDALFMIAAARWPAAKAIREIVGPLLKALVFSHHSS